MISTLCFPSRIARLDYFRAPWCSYWDSFFSLEAPLGGKYVFAGTYGSFTRWVLVAVAWLSARLSSILRPIRCIRIVQRPGKPSPLMILAYSTVGDVANSLEWLTKPRFLPSLLTTSTNPSSPTIRQHFDSQLEPTEDRERWLITIRVSPRIYK